MAPLDVETYFNTKAQKRFFLPSKVIWGAAARNNVIRLLEGNGSVALWVDTFFADTPLVQEITTALGSRLVLRREVRDMPRTGDVDAAVAALGAAPDFVIALGGGSAIDAAKAVIAQFVYGTYDGVGMGDKRGLAPRAGAKRPTFIALPTTAGTGAEASRYYVTYDTKTKKKVHGKSWRLIADWVLLDPFFLQKSPDVLLVASAFDAFVHYFESLVCAGERSWMGETLSCTGIARIVQALEEIVHQKRRTDDALTSLLYAACFGGAAISNVRTGDIHEAAGALLEHSELTHPETLFVFLEDAVAGYRSEIGDREKLLAPHLQAVGIASLDELFVFWRETFAAVGLTNVIRTKLAAVRMPRGAVEQHVFERVWSDRVWIDKESPARRSEEQVRAFITSSLARFGYPQ